MNNTISIGIQVIADKSGKCIVVRTDDKLVLYSYEKPVYYKNYNSGTEYISKEHWNYSATTMRHLADFIGMRYREVDEIAPYIKELIKKKLLAPVTLEV